MLWLAARCFKSASQWLRPELRSRPALARQGNRCIYRCYSDRPAYSRSHTRMPRFALGQVVGSSDAAGDNTVYVAGHRPPGKNVAVGHTRCAAGVSPCNRGDDVVDPVVACAIGIQDHVAPQVACADRALAVTNYDDGSARMHLGQQPLTLPNARSDAGSHRIG